MRWFGDARPWTDSVPGRGRSDLGPALAAAVAIGRRIVVVTDGELGDVPDIPAELLASTGIVVLPRARGRDLAITEVSAPARATVGDTIIVTVDVQLTGADSAETAVVVLVVRDARPRPRGRRRWLRAPRCRSDSWRERGGSPWARNCFGWASRTRPTASLATTPGRVAVELSGTPGVVMLASPGDWDARFLYRTLREVADLPVRGYVRLDGERWRDMDGLREVPAATVRAAARGADLLVVRGAARGMEEGTGARGLLRWPDAGGPAGEWYASAAPISPIGLAFLGVPVDSLPPVTDAEPLAAGAETGSVSPSRPGRRGAARPVILGRQVGRRREVTIGADGFWRWAFRGGPSGDVYRAMVAATVSWLLAEPDRGSAEARVVRRVVDQGLPVTFERTSDSTLSVPGLARVGREGAAGHAALRRRRARVALAAPGHVPVSPRAGLVAAPGPSRWTPGRGSGSRNRSPSSRVRCPRPPSAGRTSARQWPWLYALVLLSLAAEWFARRRLGLR